MSNGNKKITTPAPSLAWSKFWWTLWQLLKPFRRLIAWILIVTIVAGLFDLAKPYILKLVIDSLYNFQSIDFRFLLWLILLYLGSDQLRSLVQYFADRSILSLLVKIEYHLGLKAQSKLLDLSLAYHEDENTGSKVVKIERGIDRISQLINSIGWEVAPTFIQLIFTVPALFWADWRIGLSFMFFTPLFMAVTYWSNQKMYPVRKEIYKSYEVASGKMTQSILNINAVQSFVQEERELSDFDQIKAGVRDNENKQWSWMMKVGLGRNLIVDIGRATVLFLGVYLVYQGQISVGTLIFAFTLSEKAYASTYRLSRFYDRMEEGREGVSRLLLLFNAQSEVQNVKNAVALQDMKGSIEFCQASFKYKNTQAIALRKVSFKIEAGKTVALVGPSGGGKTTVARLIYRHYDPHSGQVLVDGQDIRGLDLFAYRRFLAIVPQEVEIFDLSVRDNIAYANPNASDKEIEEAARIANAEEFIIKLDQGYKTLVGERGLKLSGGQRQRLGIARAILANPKILIFDEATSSLDSQSELLIQSALERLAKDRTVIIIAHRLSTIKRADEIIVLENGEVVEQGNHESLAQVSGGLYAKLLRLQAVGELE
ncbi:ABC transporter ATP-binding protein/permease [Patescibacteria group bacterium]|nr:ABC transporter ATP-binding protein/permease [Patescibacteria group bacterium]